METDKQNNKRSKLKDFFFKPVVNINPSFVQYSGLGIQLAATIIVFLFIGIWLDGKFGSKFIFTLVFTLLGFAGVILKLIAVTKELDRKNKEKDGK